MNQKATSSMQESILVLTPMDVERLLNDDSADSRNSVLEKIALSYNDEAFQGREREIAEQIFRFLMKDAEVRVRESLSANLKGNEKAPRDVMLHLANDVESVSLPVISESKVLSDADLVNIVEKSPNMNKLIAISKREGVSTRVSDALVETRYEKVMVSLLNNQTARISDRSFEKIVDDFKGNEHIAEALSKQPKLPITVVERIISSASVQVATVLREQYQMGAQESAQDASAAREDIMVRLLSQELSEVEIVALVEQMSAEDRLTPSIAMTALCRGQLTFFTAALAKFSGIPVVNAKRLIEDRGEHGFNGLYQKSGLPDTMMDAIRLLLRAVQDMHGDRAVSGSMLYANRLAEKVISAAGNQPIEYLPYFIALIRQNIRK